MLQQQGQKKNFILRLFLGIKSDVINETHKILERFNGGSSIK